MGGNAEIELIDSMDPFSEGQPLEPKSLDRYWLHRCRFVNHAPQEELASDRKSVWRWKDTSISSTSVCPSRLQANTTLLYGMSPSYHQADGQDEIDAALDFKNVSIVANYIQSKTQAAQLYVPFSLRWAETDFQYRHFTA